MKKFAVILLISSFVPLVLGITKCIRAKSIEAVNGGWGALPYIWLGIILIGLGLLLAASGAAILIDRLCLSKKRKGSNKNEH